jgi:sulfatase modifying factor 1
MTRQPGRLALLVALGALSAACDRGQSESAPLPMVAGPSKAGGPGQPLGPPPGQPQPRPGMVYIPPGALVVGTKQGERPRRADRELAGEQIMLDGYYIDTYPYPNEEGAIPNTSISQAEAGHLCQERGKRLCTELEWERACKGPDNRSYEYGQSYDPSPCKTGRDAQLRPSGYHVGCQSDFGVRDLHGGPFEWTQSLFARGDTSGLVALRGGNGRAGDVVGRCANVESAPADERSGTIGFRCCAGQENPAKVELEPRFRPGLIARASFADEIERSLIAALPEQSKQALEVGGRIESHRGWLWRPVENDELHLLALCGRGMPVPHGPRCGLLIVRVVPGEIQVLAWVSSSRWVADLHRPGPHEMLWLIGGDNRGSFKRLIRYVHGDVQLGEPSRGAPKKSSKR